MTSTPENLYAAWWLYKRSASWAEVAGSGYSEAAGELGHALDHPADGVAVRGVYTSLGLSAAVDLIVWAHSPRLDRLQELALAIDKTSLGAHLDVKNCYIGIGGMSQYDPTHGPAFVKGIPPKRYLSVYPFSKTPDWFLIDYQERQRLMIEHGEMGREFPEILTNTVNSFGIQDQEFVVALEDDDPEQIIKMVQRLRAAEVRKWTALDTPIFLGDRKPAADVLNDLRGR
ncbi:MAG: chlorite dismutase family protein [Chloroflexota bacterium]|nr:chlorite dismutase family protein [Chloroflexota bacterium]